MTFKPCSIQKELKQQLESGHWPEASPAELRNHVSQCKSCSDLVLITQAFSSARSATILSASTANLSSPGLLWWRAQLRRRNAAVERIAKPILGAQIFALAIYSVIVLGLVISQAHHGLHWLSYLAERTQSTDFHLKALWSFDSFKLDSFKLDSFRLDLSPAILIPAAAMLALLSGVVLYLVTERQ
jgi:hypothetical protein